MKNRADVWQVMKFILVIMLVVGIYGLPARADDGRTGEDFSSLLFDSREVLNEFKKKAKLQGCGSAEALQLVSGTFATKAKFGAGDTTNPDELRTWETGGASPRSIRVNWTRFSQQATGGMIRVSAHVGPIPCEGRRPDALYEAWVSFQLPVYASAAGFRAGNPREVQIETICCRDLKRQSARMAGFNSQIFVYSYNTGQVIPRVGTSKPPTQAQPPKRVSRPRTGSGTSTGGSGGRRVRTGGGSARPTTGTVGTGAATEPQPRPAPKPEPYTMENPGDMCAKLKALVDHLKNRLQKLETEKTQVDKDLKNNQDRQNQLEQDIDRLKRQLKDQEGVGAESTDSATGITIRAYDNGQGEVVVTEQRPGQQPREVRRYKRKSTRKITDEIDAKQKESNGLKKKAEGLKNRQKALTEAIGQTQVRLQDALAKLAACVDDCNAKQGLVSQYGQTFPTPPPAAAEAVAAGAAAAGQVLAETPVPGATDRTIDSAVDDTTDAVDATREGARQTPSDTGTPGQDAGTAGVDETWRSSVGMRHTPAQKWNILGNTGIQGGHWSSRFGERSDLKVRVNWDESRVDRDVVRDHYPEHVEVLELKWRNFWNFPLTGGFLAPPVSHQKPESSIDWTDIDNFIAGRKGADIKDPADPSTGFLPIPSQDRPLTLGEPPKDSVDGTPAADSRAAQPPPYRSMDDAIADLRAGKDTEAVANRMMFSGPTSRTVELAGTILGLGAKLNAERLGEPLSSRDAERMAYRFQSFFGNWWKKHGTSGHSTVEFPVNKGVENAILAAGGRRRQAQRWNRKVKRYFFKRYHAKPSSDPPATRADQTTQTGRQPEAPSTQSWWTRTPAFNYPYDPDGPNPLQYGDIDLDRYSSKSYLDDYTYRGPGAAKRGETQPSSAIQIDRYGAFLLRAGIRDIMNGRTPYHAGYATLWDDGSAGEAGTIVGLGYRYHLIRLNDFRPWNAREVRDIANDAFRVIADFDTFDSDVILPFSAREVAEGVYNAVMAAGGTRTQAQYEARRAHARWRSEYLFPGSLLSDALPNEIGGEPPPIRLNQSFIRYTFNHKIGVHMDEAIPRSEDQWTINPVRAVYVFGRDPEETVNPNDPLYQKKGAAAAAGSALKKGLGFALRVLGSPVQSEEGGADDQWGLPATGFKPRGTEGSAWDVEDGSRPNVTVAVIDSGLDFNHKDRPRHLWVNRGEIPDNGLDDDGNGYVDDIHGWNFHDENNDLQDNYGHGTFVTGVIAANTNNAEGIAGINPGARIMVLKVTKPSGRTNSLALYRAIRYAVDNGARVLNISFGGKKVNTLEQIAINYAYAMGCIVVVAAGNEGGDIAIHGPPGSRRAFSVASMDMDGGGRSASNKGLKVALAAPGESVYSLTSATGKRDGKMLPIAPTDYHRLNGTSFAAPFVTGTAALIWARNPELTNRQVEDLMLYTAGEMEGPGWDVKSGAGRLDALRALTQDPSTILVPRITEYRINRQKKKITSVDVYGSVRGNLENFIVEVGRGDDPGKWQTVFGPSRYGVNQGFICRIDGKYFQKGSKWSVRIVAVSPDGESRTQQVLVARK